MAAHQGDHGHHMDITEQQSTFKVFMTLTKYGSVGAFLTAMFIMWLLS